MKQDQIILKIIIIIYNKKKILILKK
jgi:hypothetical protein